MKAFYISLLSLASCRALTTHSILVTGSSDGIGQHTASQLAQAGARVLVHGRSESKVKATIKRITEFGHDQAVLGIVADISTLAGMQSLCDQVSASTDSLSVLINNAGVYEPDYSITEDGFETTFAVNVLAPYYITQRLLPLLERCPEKPARVVNVSSISQGYEAGLDDLQFKEGGYDSHRAYSLSKLCMAMFSKELAERLAATGATKNIISNSLDPGTVNTKMLLAGWGPCGIELKQANDEFYMATAPEMASENGEYFVGRRFLEEATGVAYAVTSAEEAATAGQ